MMRLLALILVAVAAPAAAAPRPVDIVVTRDADGGWTADYRFAERAKAWIFLRSNPTIDGVPWRQQAWVVETPGVTLIRAGRYDALVADGAVPRTVRVRFKPFGEALRADYTPALVFSDGGVALYSDQFTVAPRGSIAAVAALSDDLSAVAGLERPNRLVVSAPGRRMIARGQVLAEPTFTLRPGEPDTYIYAGDAPIVATPTLAGMFDPGLPSWLRGEFDSIVPRLFALYAERLGPPKGDRPVALVAWRGGERRGRSFSGSVLTGMVVISLGGTQSTTPSPEIASDVRWFFGHESAHFWMGHTVKYDTPRQAWIMEGSADLLSIRALQALVPNYDAQARSQAEIDDCVKINAAQPLREASARGEVRANYACGAALMLAAEGAERGRDPNLDAFSFARRLIDANRADGIVTENDWLAAFAAASGDAALAEQIRGFLDRGVADPAGFFAALYAATGVKFTRDGDRVVLS